MNELPTDIRLLQTEPASPAEEFGVSWCPAGVVPSELIDGNHQSAEERAAWASLLRELSFFATESEGGWLALWRHTAGISVEQAPIVLLDTEGHLSCVAARFADWFILEAAQPELVRAWFLRQGVDVARDQEDVWARCRFEPDPQARLERLREGQSLQVVSRDVEPTAPEQLLGMHGSDARARAYLARIERKDRPLEVSCDFAGRIDTLWLKSERLTSPLSVRGVTVGGPVSQLASLGTPTRSGDGWHRWDAGDVALHLQHAEGRVQVITLMYRPALPPHLR